MSSAADPTAAFFANLRASGLLKPPQLQELWQWVATTKPDVQNLAKEVSRRAWLTTFQIKEIFKGRGRDLTLDRYVLLDLLGEGGMGRVYKAHDVRLGCDRAIKIIRKDKLKHPAAGARFEQEIQALSKMSHPNVVQVFDAAVGGDTNFYVMELIDGTDLTKMVRDRGPLPVPEACEYIRQAALGLQHAFEKGLVHRDIKPSNIIVSRNGRVVKVVDLGLARLMENEAAGGEDGHRITQEGFVIGTPDFLAPEQARNPMGVDIRADVYALGGTLYYILTGKVPFEGSNPTEKLLKHCTEPPPSLLAQRMDAPPPLEQIIHWCMAKPPEGRPQTPLQLALALQPFCPVAPPGYGGPTSGKYPVAGSGLLSAGRHPVQQGTGTGSHTPIQPPAVTPGSGPVAVPPGYPAPPPGYAYPAPPPGYPGYPPGYPGYPPGFPAPPEPDPNRSSQVFKLPPQTTTEDPIRRRSEGGFPWSLVLLGLGALFVVGLLGWASYVQFLRPVEPPIAEFTNSVKMKMVKLDGGKFRMGSAEGEQGRRIDEGPQHEVSISGPLLMSATEVTHSQYLQVMGTSPAKSGGLANKAQNLPVEFVSWDDANDFCQKLTNLENEKKQPWARRNWAYRLPTEAEWEYAARAGSSDTFAFGPTITFGKQGGIFRLMENDPLGVPDEMKPPTLALEVGKTKANDFGLYDMHGNAAEWVADWYKPSYPGEGSRTDPTGPPDGDKRVVRGGSFKDPANAVRSAARAGFRPTDKRDDIGFRVVYAPK